MMKISKLISKILFACCMLFTANLCLADDATTPAKLRWATEPSYPPFESVAANGQIIGFDVDIAKALCHQMQVECTFNNAPWDSLIPSLKLGKYDVLIGAMGITPERQKQVDFTNSYYENTATFVAPKKEKLVISAEGLKGKTIGTQAGTTFINYLQSTYGKTIHINGYPSQEQAFLDLKSGRVDAIIGDTPLVEHWIKEAGNDQYEIIGEPISDKEFFGPGNGIAVKKGNSELLAKLNAALATIKANGSYNKILHTWFGQ